MTKECLIAQVQASDPGAATPLYNRFAAGLRVLFEHKLPGADPEACVFHVLVTVARAVRQGQIQNSDELVAEVRATANAFIAEAATTRDAACKGPVRETRIGLGKLNPRDREILRRSYNLEQPDGQVSREMRVPLNAVVEVKRRSRRRFLSKKAS